MRVIKAFSLWVLLSFVISIKIHAQHSWFQVGTQVPLAYTIGYEYESENRSGFNFQAGILTKPYDHLIVDLLKTVGIEEVLANTIDEAFTYGYTFQPTLKIHFPGIYIGFSYSYFSLYARETIEDAIKSYYGIQLPSFIHTSPLHLRSNLSNIGLLAGKRFNSRNTGLSFSVEVSLLKTVYSNSRLTTESGDTSTGNDTVNNKLKTYYLEYGYLPSLNIFLLLPLKLDLEQFPHSDQQ